MMSIIPKTARSRRAYDHRLREHGVRSGARSLGHRLAIPRSTISSWPGATRGRHVQQPVVKVSTSPFGRILARLLRRRSLEYL